MSMKDYVPPELRPSPWWKKLLSLALLAAFLGGLYYLYETGELLNLLNLLLEQDPVVLLIASIVGLLALALMMRV